MKNKIEFIDLKTQYSILKESINQRIQNVLNHGQYIMGPEVAELEQQLCQFTGSPHCITVSSGTEALLIALMAIGIQPGDEVITTPFTFAATAEVIVLAGAVPVFVDIDPLTCNIDPNLIEAAITSKTKAIMPVSLYGQVADMDEINNIAKKYENIVVIEDAAQSFGAEYKNHKSCNLSTIGCTSFFPSKPLGCYGDGGAIFTNDPALAKAMREIRIHGQERRYLHNRIGVGGRMDTLQCAIVLAKLEVFEEEIRQRIKIGQRYFDLLKDIPGIQLPIIGNNRTHVWGQFTVRVKEREKVLNFLKDCNIPTAVHYPIPLNLQPAYEMYTKNSDLKYSIQAASEVFSLPMSPYLTEEQQDEIVLQLKVIMQNSMLVKDVQSLEHRI